MRIADARLSYACLDSVRGRVAIWHGPASSPAIRGRATRVALMLAAEAGFPCVLAPSYALRASPTDELHSPPPRLFPRSLDEAREGLGPSAPVHLSDGRRSSFVWLPNGLDVVAAAAGEVVEREGCESAVFRAHFRVAWGPTGDVVLRRAKAVHRFAARRPFEASCAPGQQLAVLGEGRVPHWCYALNLATASRGLLPLAVFSELPLEQIEVHDTSSVDGPASPRSPGRSGGENMGAASSSSSSSSSSVGSASAAAGLKNSSSRITLRKKSTSGSTERGRVGEKRRSQATPREESSPSFPGIRMRVVDDSSGNGPVVSPRSGGSASSSGRGSTPTSTPGTPKKSGSGIKSGSQFQQVPTPQTQSPSVAVPTSIPTGTTTTASSAPTSDTPTTTAAAAAAAAVVVQPVQLQSNSMSDEEEEKESEEVLMFE